MDVDIDQIFRNDFGLEAEFSTTYFDNPEDPTDDEIEPRRNAVSACLRLLSSTKLKKGSVGPKIPTWSSEQEQRFKNAMQTLRLKPKTGVSDKPRVQMFLPTIKPKKDRFWGRVDDAPHVFGGGYKLLTWEQSKQLPKEDCSDGTGFVWRDSKDCHILWVSERHIRRCWELDGIDHRHLIFLSETPPNKPEAPKA